MNLEEGKIESVEEQAIAGGKMGENQGDGIISAETTGQQAEGQKGEAIEQESDSEKIEVIEQGPVVEQKEAGAELEGEAGDKVVAEEYLPTEKELGESAEEKQAEEIIEPPKGEKRWYVIQALTGQEDKVKKAIEQTVENNRTLKGKVFQVLVPMEETVEIKGGKRVEKIRKMFPGYVFLEMILDEESWFLIRQTDGVARFIGSKVSPTPVSDKEMQRVLKQLGKEERLEINFEKGEGVRVIAGPFRGYTGTVDEINADKEKLKVLINIFGRDTPVEVNFEHAQKIE